jgi:hypothetical protein
MRLNLPLCVVNNKKIPGNNLQMLCIVCVTTRVSFMFSFIFLIKTNFRFSFLWCVEGYSFVGGEDLSIKYRIIDFEKIPHTHFYFYYQNHGQIFFTSVLTMWDYYYWGGRSGWIPMMEDSLTVLQYEEINAGKCCYHRAPLGQLNRAYLL